MAHFVLPTALQTKVETWFAELLGSIVKFKREDSNCVHGHLG